MTTEKIKLEVRICPETQKPFVCDQHGRGVAAVLNSVISNGIKQVAQVTMTAHLHADGKKYTGRKASFRDLTPLEYGEAIHKAVPDDVKSPSMRLVDILARELKAWPEDFSERVGQCINGRLHGYAGNGHPNCQVTHRPFTLCSDFQNDTVTRAEWQAAVDALKVAEGIADAEAGNLNPLDEVKDKWALIKAMRESLIDGSRRIEADSLAFLIDEGWIDPSSFLTRWPRETYGFELSPKITKYEDPADHKECPEFLKSRIESLEAELAQAHEKLKERIVIEFDDNMILAVGLGYSKTYAMIGGRSITIAKKGK